jgi:class 3 adenylate cyclase/tetratricopeptide (TPR) repeat protein
MLFSDVKGSTPMAERLDPEDMMEIMDGAFDVLIEPITQYEGTLARLAGDGVLAFFGAPIAHEDDAERACRAALEIIERAGEYAARLEEERGISGFNVRVGIHTGLVVVGEVGSDLRVEYTAIGDAANLASRMETAAKPGTVLISEDTHRLIAPLFETEALGPIEVKGKAEPVSVHRVLVRRPASAKPRGIKGLESPLVGREAEFRALSEALERLQAGVGGIVTIVGEAGIGKSRLVAQLRKSAAPLDLEWVEGRSLSYGGSIAYLPWLDMLHGPLGMSVEDPPLAVRDALRRWVQALCPDHFDEVYPYLGRMMSLPLEEEAEARLRGIEPEGMKVLTFRAVERVVESAARERPLVLVCEDLHWADPTSLELVEHLLPLTDRASLLLVSAFRPYRDHGCWGIREAAGRRYPHRLVDLPLVPLTAAESERLVGNLLEVEALPRPLRERILTHAEGNPFYVEEVIRSFIDSEIIVYDGVMEQWQAMQRVEEIAIPDSLQGVLMARIDRLEEESRRVLQLASVIGRIFPYRVLSAIVAEDEELDQRLLTLQREEMIRERARVPELEYIFKHHLTQEAAYNGLLRRERRSLHRQVAEAMERVSPDRVEEQLGLLAHHWESAGEREEAGDYLRRAGEQAAQQFANTEAAGYFSRALELTPVEDLAERFELLLAREDVYDVQGDRDGQRQDLEGLQELADSIDDDSRRAEVALRQANCAHHLPDYPAEIDAARTAVRLAHPAGDGRREAQGYAYWASALHFQGNYRASRSRYEQALALARTADFWRAESKCLLGLGHVSIAAGDFAASRAYYEENVRLCHEAGDRRRENVARLFLAGAMIEQGNYDEVRTCCEQAVSVLREVGDRWNEAWSHELPGRVYQALGDYETARSHYERYLQGCRDVGDDRGVVFALAELALASHHVGDDEGARQLAQQAADMARGQGHGSSLCTALTRLAHALVSLARLDEAEDVYRNAVALWHELGQPRPAVEALAGLARVRQAHGDLLQAQHHVEEILTYLETASFDGIDEPARVYLTCYRVLRANGDPRAHDILERGYRFLQERAAKISDEGERRSYLENVAANREIVSEYERWQRDVAGE